MSGLGGLPLDQARQLIQEIETKATLRAIENKKRDINILVRQMEKIKEGKPDDDSLVRDNRLLQMQRKKIEKKMLFLERCEEERFADWRMKRGVAVTTNAHCKRVSERKLKRKMKAKSRKLRKKEEAIKERAQKALDKNLVINLTDVDIPLFAVAVLSYGPGWIPCPKFDSMKFTLDGYNAGNKQAWKAKFKGKNSNTDVPLALLKKEVTSTCTTFDDPAIKDVRDGVAAFVENFTPKRLKTNMNKFEREGFDWLSKSVREGTIAVTSADKGGAIVVMTPELIRNITNQKVSDISRYKCLGSKDPTPVLRKTLLNLWGTGCEQSYVTTGQAKKTVGLIFKGDGNSTQSTDDAIKPGIPYGYPLPKIHKLTVEELAAKKVPPARFVTDLSQGVTARSDKFLVWKWLGPLSRDYCTDLVRDSTAALLNLERLVEVDVVDDSWCTLSIDVVSLYDSLRHELVLEALSDAMETCRPDWTPEFRRWLMELVQHSFDSAVLKNKDSWYEVENGVPTGGITSVDCGNITLFYVLKTLVYAPDKKPQFLRNQDRFVDDISSQCKAPVRVVETWVKELREEMVSRFSLDITHEIKGITEYTQFLDFVYKVEGGKLTTDLYRKKTDANRYLEFSSYHPRHTFRSIVYSQALRYRRLINDDEILSGRLEELICFFVDSSYPKRMVEEIVQEVKQKSRELGYRDRPDAEKKTTPWIITFGAGYDESKKKADELNRILENSNTWKGLPSNEIPRLQIVTRRGPNTKDTLFRRRALAIGSKSKATVPCTRPGEAKAGPRCQTCQLVSGTDSVTNNNHTIKSAGGNCTSNNIVYAARCKLCTTNSVYVGKTVTPLRQRVNGHRNKFHKLVKTPNPSVSEITDENILGAHLYFDHGLRSVGAFNQHYVFDVLHQGAPGTLRKYEQSLINDLGTLYPLGLNQIKSIAGS